MDEPIALQQQPEWPNFHWNWERIATGLAEVRFRQGSLLGSLQALDPDRHQQLTLDTLISSVISSYSISSRPVRRRRLDPNVSEAFWAQTFTAVARELQLGRDDIAQPEADIEGLARVTVDATQNCTGPLTADRLHGWHRELFSAEHYREQGLSIGRWRQADYAPGRPGAVITYAPPANAVDTEMSAFLDWFNRPDETDPVVKAAVSHLWFACIRPFDDGNGRIVRAITDMALARSDGTDGRAYAMSDQMLADRRTYRRVLIEAQSSSMDITPWVDWFVWCLLDCLTAAGERIEPELRRSRFWQAHRHIQINDRQRRALDLAFDHHQDNQDGQFTTRGWSRNLGCSHDTALRDINDLIDKGILVPGPRAGNLTTYELNHHFD